MESLPISQLLSKLSNISVSSTHDMIDGHLWVEREGNKYRSCHRLFSSSSGGAIEPHTESDWSYEYSRHNWIGLHIRSIVIEKPLISYINDSSDNMTRDGWKATVAVCAQNVLAEM